MSADRDPIEELLASISDGHAIDWEKTAAAARPDTHARLRALHDIANIADFNRTLQAATHDAGLPERWGELLLLERIGSGGYGDVHRAWDPRLQREVALKLLHEGGDGADLLAEGRAAARIRHANVVSILGIDQKDGRIGLWMELVRGIDLSREVAARGPLAPADAARLGIEIGGALAAVHAAGLVHRDVKPANVVRDEHGRHVLADFGLGARWDSEELRAAGTTGTPMYMAPELLAGGEATTVSDVYALGALLWFALTGRQPLPTSSLEELRMAAARGPSPSLAEVAPHVPAQLVRIIEAAMAPEPARRTGSARAVVDALEGWSSQDVSPAPIGTTSPALRPGWRRLLFAGAAAAVAVIAALVVTPGGPFRRAKPAVSTAPAPAAPAPVVYSVTASLLRREGDRSVRLVSGDRVRPGDKLALAFRATRPTWVYVLNEDERGERYLLFPQPLFETGNPIAADSSFVLPGRMNGHESAWSVTSAGGREHFLIVASPEPVAELEAELDRLPAPEPDRPIRYAAVGRAAMDRLRGVGGVVDFPAPRARGPEDAQREATAFDRFRVLGAPENGVTGVWVRHVELENPAR